MPERIRQRIKSIGVAATVIVALAAPVPGAATPADIPDTRPRADDAQLRQALQEIRLQHAVPGMAAAVFDAEDTRVFAVGELEPGGNPVTPESRFRVGQVSLLFNGLLAAALVTDGSMSADGELRRLAPEVDMHNPWSDERPVRIEDLLAHRAGLGVTRFRDVYADTPGQPLLVGINRAFRALRLINRPGDVEHYSVVGPAIVAYMAEKAAGMPYEDALQRLLFMPLEMEATLGRVDGPRSFDSVGHSGRPALRVADLPLNLPPAGDLWISAKDLAQVGRLLLDRGRRGDQQVVAEAAVDWMEAAVSDTALQVPGKRRGLAVEEHGGFLFHTQTGAMQGFLARFAYSRELGKGYLVLLNHGGGTAALADAEALLRGQIVADAVAPAVPVAASEGVDLDALAGWYRNVSPEPAPRAFFQSWSSFMNATRCDGHLCVARPFRQTRLESFDGTRLREEGRWYPGWHVRATAAGLLLEGRGAAWQPVSGWQVLARGMLVLIVFGGILAASVLLPYWTWSILRWRLRNYHALVPRLLPLSAIAALVVFQVLLFSVDYPELGRAGTPGITILVFSILAPVLAFFALPAALAGFAWKLPWRALIAPLYLSVVAWIVAIALAQHDLVAFRTWVY
ncbi:MAG: beta-lactamase family protein [Proteobacteria bacterium]|nr:beta-lactamase family protein [Pseudomonadota bacterium]